MHARKSLNATIFEHAYVKFQYKNPIMHSPWPGDGLAYMFFFKEIFGSLFLFTKVSPILPKL